MAQSREKQIIKVSIIGIVTNLLLAGVKILVGLLSNSIAIISDAVNNIADSSSSIITIVGTKLSQRQPDRKHPFGYGRIEYLTSMVIGIIVLVTGLEMAISSVKGIIHPEKISFSYLTVLILAITMAAKIILGLYTKATGKKVDSGALIASGADALNDAIISAVTIVSALVFLWFDVSIDAWAGALISIFIIKTGAEVLKDTISKLLGEQTDKELADEIYSMIKSNNMVIGAHDMILHNYGPERHIGSVNLEIDHDKTISEVYPILHQLQIQIYQATKTYVVFGLYSIDEQSASSQKAIQVAKNIQQQTPHCLGFHGINVDDNFKVVFCDLLLDYDCDRMSIQHQAEEMFKEAFPGYQPMITIDTPFTEM